MKVLNGYIHILKNNSEVTGYFGSGDDMRIEPVVFRGDVFPAASVRTVNENPIPSFDGNNGLCPTSIEVVVFGKTLEAVYDGWVLIIQALDGQEKLTIGDLEIVRIRYEEGGGDFWDESTELFMKSAEFLTHYKR